MKAIEQYLHLVLFIMLDKEILTFDSVYEILKCIHMTTIERYLHRVLFVFFFSISFSRKWKFLKFSLGIS